MLFASLGGILALVGTIWLVVIAIQTGHTNGEKVIWALVNFLCQPLGGIVFFIVKRDGLIPLIFVLIGSVLLGIGNYSLMMDMMNQMPR